MYENVSILNRIFLQFCSHCIPKSQGDILVFNPNQIKEFLVKYILKRSKNLPFEKVVLRKKFLKGPALDYERMAWHGSNGGIQNVYP